MTIEVIGAGFGRTGTLSLKLALETLGFEKCYHMLEVAAHPEHVSMWTAAGRGEPVDWDVLFTGYRATVDWPSCKCARRCRQSASWCLTLPRAGSRCAVSSDYACRTSRFRG